MPLAEVGVLAPARRPEIVFRLRVGDLLAAPSRTSCVAFGLATDYGVFLLSRIMEARDHGASDSEAVAVGLERTGRIGAQREPSS